MHSPDEKQPLDPSRVVSDRRWSDWHGRLEEAGETAQNDSPNWLSGLVQSEHSPATAEPQAQPTQDLSPTPPPLQTSPPKPISPPTPDTTPLPEASPKPAPIAEDPPAPEATQEVPVSTLLARHRSASKSTAPKRSTPQRAPLGRAGAREKAVLYRSISAMFEAGVPLFAIFEFLSREGESASVSMACRRIAQRLVAGFPLHAAAREEPQLFDPKAVRMLEAGVRGGDMSHILVQLAQDEEQAWKVYQTLRSQLLYPTGVAALTLLAVLMMPPLVLSDLLRQVVSLSVEPPRLTLWLLKLSEMLADPVFIGLLVVPLGAFFWWFRSVSGRALIDKVEPELWDLQAFGSLWRNVVGMRFLRVFSMTYQAGLPVLVALELATTSTGSRAASESFVLMKQTMLEGGSLRESFEVSGFLPQIALEAISAGEMSGKVPDMLQSAAEILDAEVQSRVEAVAKLIEPLVLAVMGVIVGTFVLGCLLPIVELVEKL